MVKRVRLAFQPDKSGRTFVDKNYNQIVKTKDQKSHLASAPTFDWWVLYVFTFFYIAVEFGFNYQLLNLTVDFVAEDVLLGLEFWGRVISGIGLSLVLMWNVQKMLTDYLVDQASLEDKKSPYYLRFLALRQPKVH